MKAVVLALLRQYLQSELIFNEGACSERVSPTHRVLAFLVYLRWGPHHAPLYESYLS